MPQKGLRLKIINFILLKMSAKVRNKIRATGISYMNISLSF
jgi:hypothetical protein